MKSGWIVLAAAAALWAKDSCIECHRELEGELGLPAKAYSADVHAGVEFGCVACHGGDASQDDMALAKSRARGFRGKIARTAVPELCASCHSDATLIHKYNPQQRIDQLALYKTSVHGRRLAAGDTAVANCVDCHGVHNIRKVRDALSPVHPLRLPETCGKCHADPKHMARYKLPTNQLADYQASVHWAALAKRGDLSAPSCASCHGNHGATPPGVDSVAAVCGTCHVLLEQLFRKSPHQPVFEQMGRGACIVCHGNHRVEHPTPALLVGDKAVCAECHTADDAGGKAAAEMGRLILELNERLNRSDEILQKARQSGMEVSEALVRQMEGRESLVKARVAVHAFDVAAVREPASKGIEIADETYQAGLAALRERNVRRIGLGISLITILVVMLGLWLAIRTIEGSPSRNSNRMRGGRA